MRILYGVTGCGLGHTMRARAVAAHLCSRGHHVRIAASGRAVAILRGHGLDVVAIDGMAMRFAGGEARRAKSALTLLRQAPRAIRRNAASNGSRRTSSIATTAARKSGTSELLIRLRMAVAGACA